MRPILDKGYTVVGPAVNLAAAGAANATAIFQRSNFAQQIGTKSFKLRKVTILNNAGGNTTISIGTGVAGLFVAMIPALQTINNMADSWGPDQLPEVEFFADMTAFPLALAGGGSIDIVVEVEEIG